MGSLNPFNLLECHFNWDIRSVVGDKDIANKLCEKNEEIFGQPWRNILISLTTAYEMFVKNDSGAADKLQDAIIMWGNTNDDFTLKYKDAFRHVIYSLKLFFVKDSSSERTIKEILDYIPPLETLPSEQKVALIAIKAHVFSEYGQSGTKHALILGKEAVRKNPDEGEWSFLVGKMLSRIRHFNYDHCITEEEIECFRHAYAKQKTPAHAVFLAQVYSTVAKGLFKKLPVIKGRKTMNDNERTIIKSYNEKAYNLFKEALKGNNNTCVHTDFRCARGLYHLPGEFKDIKLALELVEKNLERAPTNVYGNTVASKIYYALKQYGKAFKHAEAAEEDGSFGASALIFQMKIELKREIDTEKEYEAMFKKHPEYHIQICLHAITYYIFKRRHIFRALKYFFKAADLDATLDQFYIYVHWIREQTDVCFLVYNEVKAAADAGKSRNVQDLKKLRDAVTIICTKYPTVSEKTLNPKLVDLLLNKSKFPTRNGPKKNFTKNNETSEISKKKENYNNSNKNNFKGTKANENRVNRKNQPKNQKSRSRTNSVSSNASDTSTCSFASAASFTKIRRNSRDASLLNIVKKDLELKKRCEEFKEAADNKVASLRPCHDQNRITLGFSNKPATSLSMGCGWNSKSKSNENLLNKRQNDNFSKMNKNFDNMNIGNNKRNIVRNRSTEGSRPTQYENKGQRSLSAKRNESKSNTEHNSVNTDDFKASSSYNKRNYFSNTNETKFNRSFSNKESPKGNDQSAEGYNRKFNKNTSNSSEIIYAGKGQIRRPFNLKRSDSLDSDDSVSLRQSPSRSSISSVDDDYKATRSYFPWHNKRDN